MQDIDLGGDAADRDWKCATFKQEEDFTDRTNLLVAEWGSENAKRFQKEGLVEQAIEKLLEMEKKSRLGGDAKNCIRVATEIMRLVVAASTAARMMEVAELLMKRRAQMKGVQIVVVKEAHKCAEGTADKETKITLLKQLREVCSGKLHVELEFARISVQLSDIFEADGKLKDAVEMMNGVQVETITNMERAEKLRILLLQIRLNLDADDFIRAAIMARKTSSRALSKPDSMLIKATYFEYMLRYYGHYRSYWHLAKCWMELHKLSQSEEFQKEHPSHHLASDKVGPLTHVLLFLLLSPTRVEVDSKITDCAAFSPWNKGTERLEMVKQYVAEKAARELTKYQQLCKQFQGSELIHWPEFQVSHTELKQHPIFQGDGGEERWEALHLRVTQHNIKVIAKYYERVRLPRLASLIDLDERKAEQHVCDMVISKDLWARVDRIDGIISFTRKKDSAGATADWAEGIEHVLGQVTTACHLIQKEYMIHGIPEP
eukprot:Hpha_TRINITY_DN16651_c0_g8::TRINITY_DN16651_c0_g8_i1::g.179288::m.179288/K03035/PSMD12, RPN5; 26S proteasome regulatory subunit N5